LLAGDYPTLTLAIAGDGPLRESLATQASALGIAGRVHLLGHRPDVQALYDAADVFTLPSLYEAMPYALLEAMSAGLPVVATNVSGVPEVVLPGCTGTLVPPANAHALAAALRPLLDSPGLREQMGRAGRERVLRDFNERETMPRTIDVYRDMLRNRTGRSGLGRTRPGLSSGPVAGFERDADSPLDSSGNARQPAWSN
jgi:glycosyltransferase involved in cell wall biosynthesis